MFRRDTFMAARSPLLSRYTQTMGELALREQSEKALLAAKQESDLANRAKSSFLGTMSHELRTPLNAIIGFSDIIGQAETGGGTVQKHAEYAAEIAKAGKHMLGIITDILDMSKLESGTFQLNLDEHDIGELVEDAVGMVRQRTREKNQTLDMRLGKGLPEIQVDARRVRQILINLLSNAHKFSAEGTTIVVSARRTKEGGATISVVDQGIGMRPEDMATAMQPFGQIHSIYTRQNEGTGLGLAIARGLALRHGGDLFLESEPDVGTAVTLTLRQRVPVLPFAQEPLEGGGERIKPRRPTIANKEPPA
jgi:two-component system cell cycle sensor histidine kinase PleC